MDGRRWSTHRSLLLWARPRDGHAGLIVAVRIAVNEALFPRLSSSSSSSSSLRSGAIPGFVIGRALAAVVRAEAKDQQQEGCAARGRQRDAHTLNHAEGMEMTYA